MRHIDAIHVVPVLAPVSTTVAVQTDVVGFKNNHAVKFLILAGALAADLAITVEKCDDTTPSSSAEIAFKYRKTSAVGTDQIGDYAEATSAGVALAEAADDEKIVEIVIEGSDCGEDYPYVRAVLTPASADACLVAGIAVLESRYLQAVPPSSVA